MNGNNSSKDWGLDLNTHHLLTLKHLPPSLLQLRRELLLPQNKDIYEASFKGESFEQCLGIIGAQLGIELDGVYDVSILCEQLLTAMRSRRSSIILPN